MQRSFKQGCTEYIEDITKDKFNDEAFCRDHYTSHESMTIKPLDEVASQQYQAVLTNKSRRGSSSGSKSVGKNASCKKNPWEKVNVSKNFLAEQDMQRKIVLLNKKKSVVDRRNGLFNNQQMQVTRVLAEENLQEDDPEFVWTLAQLDRKLSDKNQKGERRILALTVYLRRAPKPGVDCILLHKRLREEARRLQRPVIPGTARALRDNTRDDRRSATVLSNYGPRLTGMNQNNLNVPDDRSQPEPYSSRGVQQGYLANDNEQNDSYAIRGGQTAQYSSLNTGFQGRFAGYGQRESSLPVYPGAQSNRLGETADSQRQGESYGSQYVQPATQTSYAGGRAHETNVPSRSGTYGAQSAQFSSGRGIQRPQSAYADQGHQASNTYSGTSRLPVGKDARDRQCGNASRDDVQTADYDRANVAASAGGDGRGVEIAPGIQIIGQESDTDADSESDSSKNSRLSRNRRARSRQPSVRSKMNPSSHHIPRRRSRSVHEFESSSTDAMSDDSDSYDEGDTTPTSINDSTRRWGNVRRRVPQRHPDRSSSTQKGTARRLSTSRTRHKPSVQQTSNRTSGYPANEVNTVLEELLAQFARAMPTTHSTQSRFDSDSLTNGYANVHSGATSLDRDIGKAQERRLSALQDEMVRSRVRERAVLEAQRRQQEDDLMRGSTAPVRPSVGQEIPRYVGEGYLSSVSTEYPGYETGLRDDFNRADEAYRPPINPFTPPAYRNPFMPL